MPSIFDAIVTRGQERTAAAEAAAANAGTGIQQPGYETQYAAPTPWVSDVGANVSSALQSWQPPQWMQSQFGPGQQNLYNQTMDFWGPRLSDAWSGVRRGIGDTMGDIFGRQE